MKDKIVSKTYDKTFKHLITHTHIMIEITWTEPMLKSKAVTLVQNNL